MGLQLLETLSDSEQARADELVAELIEQYGDGPLLVKAIRRDLRELKNRTGSRLGSGSSPMLIIYPDSTGESISSGDTYYDALEARIRYRIQMLGGTVTLGELNLIDVPEPEPQSDSETALDEAPLESDEP